MKTIWKMAAAVALGCVLVTSRAEIATRVVSQTAYASRAGLSDSTVGAAVEEAFPKLTAEKGLAETLERAANDKTMRGNLRGRLAEADWLERHSSDGWRRTASRTATENDAWRRLADQTLEGAQVKVHSDWKEYLRSMRKDRLAERFVIPDDHLELVKQDLLTRQRGAIRGGNAGKAATYSRMAERLTPLGRTFAEIDGSIDETARALKAAGRVSAAARTQAREQLRTMGEVGSPKGRSRGVTATSKATAGSGSGRAVATASSEAVGSAGVVARKVLRAAPAVGVGIEVGVRGYNVYQTESEFAVGKISASERGARHSENVGGAVGGIGGAAAGAAAGAAVGGMVGGVGAVPGAIIGAAIGGVSGDFVGARAGKAAFEAW